MRVTNQHHLNTMQFGPSQLLIAGPLSVSAALSSAQHDVGTLLAETILVTQNINKVNAGDVLGAITYVVATRPVPENDGLEEVDILTYNIKNINMPDLRHITFPAAMWATPDQHVAPDALEAVLQKECPLLYHRIATRTFRRALRVKVEQERVRFA
jgi:hypothetical protein